MVYEEANCSYRLLTDTPIYTSALVSEDVSEAIAKSRLDVCISNLIRDSGCSEYKLFVSGGSNFRYEIDPQYKVNRTGADPKWREAPRLHLIKEWGAIECIGFEADDMCGVEQKQDGSTMIVAIDKDLLQVPGLHYSWPIIRKGAVIREAIFQEISVEQGWRNLFTQTLTGDVSDNIKGIYRIGKVKAAEILRECYTEEEMYAACWYQYILDDPEGEQRFHKNCDLLYIWRELGITYSIRREIYG